MKVALVHDWLTGMRGGEKVLEVLCERFPEAELFTLVHVPGSVSPAIERLRIQTSALQRLPAIHRYYRECLPLFPTLIERFDLGGFDLVISTSHCVAKSAIAAPGAVHICYCLTPMRYAWDQFDAYFGPQRLGRPASFVMRRVMNRLARWDRETASRANRYLAISHYVAGRIGRYYNREATVVYPPVDTDYFRPGPNVSGGYALVVSALVPYKRIDLAIDACQAAGIPLKIVGTGPDRPALARRAARRRHDTAFLGYRSDEEVRELYRAAQVVLLPGEEDFGIVPLEAQACGRPVVAYARGGALETVIDGETGFLVEEPAPGAFAEAIQRASHHPFDATVIRRHAERFGKERFAHEIDTVIRDTVASQVRTPTAGSMSS
ncbi:MAG TPA: glycosyltransferase [Vicinamibacterales bacterium]|nr:glycosyltransferase [Vicinamibacterales bacterium]